MIKQGIYCSVKQQEVEDVHAGATLKDVYYHHICFYLPEKLVGFYGGAKLWSKPFLDKSFRYAGEITAMDNDRISFSINDPYNNDKILFTGTHHENRMELVARRSGNPDAVWLEDTFEFIGAGEV